jgi:hypothetical protein
MERIAECSNTVGTLMDESYEWYRWKTLVACDGDVVHKWRDKVREKGRRGSLIISKARPIYTPPNQDRDALSVILDVFITVKC